MYESEPRTTKYSISFVKPPKGFTRCKTCRGNGQICVMHSWTHNLYLNCSTCLGKGITLIPAPEDHTFLYEI